MRTRVMNQLQAIAMNEGIRRKKGLWSRYGLRKMKAHSLLERLGLLVFVGPLGQSLFGDGENAVH